MNAATLVSLSLGSMAVLQAALNRRIATAWGLAPAILLNGIVVLVLCGAFYGAARRGWIDAVAEGASVGSMSLTWLLPGVFGFLLITGLPWAVGQIGATRVFVGVVFAQMATSLIWDRLVESIALTPSRILGAVLCAAGVALAASGR
ncbi:MAG: DMT family transporter [Myxococcota bacterium]